MNRLSFLLEFMSTCLRSVRCSKATANYQTTMEEKRSFASAAKKDSHCDVDPVTSTSSRFGWNQTTRMSWRTDCTRNPNASGSSSNKQQESPTKPGCCWVLMDRRSATTCDVHSWCHVFSDSRLVHPEIAPAITVCHMNWMHPKTVVKDQWRCAWRGSTTAFNVWGALQLFH